MTSEKLFILVNGNGVLLTKVTDGSNPDWGTMSTAVISDYAQSSAHYVSGLEENRLGGCRR